MKAGVIMPPRAEADFGTRVRFQLIKTGTAALGIPCIFMNTEELRVEYFGQNQHEVFYGEERISELDIVINALHTPEEPHSNFILRHLEESGVPVVNSLSASINTKFKPFMIQRLSSAGIRIPKSIILGTYHNLDEAVDFLGGFPIVLKTSRGWKGAGVSLCESMRSLKSVVQCLIALDHMLILQEFIAESEGIDYKIVATRDQILCSFRRQATSRTEFRANVSLGGKGTLVTIGKEMAELSQKAIKSLGLVFGSVDIIQSKEGQLVVEVNDLPELNLSIDGTEFVEIDFAKYFVEHLIRQTQTDANLRSCRISDLDYAIFNPRSDFDSDYYQNLSEDKIIII